jgi:hypothetical protein
MQAPKTELPLWLHKVSITDIVEAIEYMKKANEDAMRAKIRASLHPDRLLKLHNPYPLKVISALENALKEKVDNIKESLKR